MDFHKRQPAQFFVICWQVASRFRSVALMDSAECSRDSRGILVGLLVAGFRAQQTTQCLEIEGYAVLRFILGQSVPQEIVNKGPNAYLIGFKLEINA